MAIITVPIQVKQGAASGLPTLLSGEFGWTTDTHALYIGDGSANHLISQATGTVTSVAAGTGLTGGTITTSGTIAVSYGTSAGTSCQGNDSRLSDSRAPSGSAGGDLTGSYPNPTLGTSGVAAATYGDAAHVAQIAVDAKGRITSASSVTITAGVGIGSPIFLGTTNYVLYLDAGPVLAQEQYLSPARGGLGIDASNPSNGQLLIGTGTGWAVHALASADGTVTFTTGAGTLDLSASSYTASTPANWAGGTPPTTIAAALDRAAAALAGLGAAP